MAMMGIQDEPAQLFYDFCLDDHVPGDHILRGIDRFLDLSDAREKLKPFHRSIGRPSIDPELIIRMLLVGYCMGIRSERRLCDEVHLNLAYRWFCRLGLNGRVPDHSTFSRNRHGRFRDSDILRHLFESVLVWVSWRTPILEELVKTWPSRAEPTDADREKGWWLPTKPELVRARKAARSLERQRSRDRQAHSV